MKYKNKHTLSKKTKVNDKKTVFSYSIVDCRNCNYSRNNGSYGIF